MTAPSVGRSGLPLGGALLVAGTDTGVGKTCVTAGLARALVRRGLHPTVWKPFATGVPADRLEPGEDADLLGAAVGLPPEARRDIVTWRFAMPAAPARAAAAEGRSLPLRASPADLPSTAGGPLLVEGCGGWRVPLGPGLDADFGRWASGLGMPVLVVASGRLGTLNHTRLAVDAIESDGLDVLGVVVVRTEPATIEDEMRDDPRLLQASLPVPVLGVMQAVREPRDVDALADAVDAAIDVDALHARIREATSRAGIEALERADRRDVWHPFTQMREYEDRDPIVIERGDGVWLGDIRGRRYLDGVASLWVNVLGHRDPHVDRAVRRQLGRVAHSTLLGLGNDAAAAAATRLLEHVPGEGQLTRVFWSDNGSTAVEVALKMAWQAARQRGEERRRVFVHFEDGYHGDTLGAVSVGGIDVFHATFDGLLFDAVRLPAPWHHEASLGALQALLQTRGDEIAAVVVEPLIQGAGGMRRQRSGWLAEVARGTRAAGALLIADEVATGFGRTGRWFAVEHEGVVPDLLCVAKGLTGGYLPLAATVASDAVYEAFLAEPAAGKQLFHGHTYTGNPLACAAALATMERMEALGLVAHAERMGRHLETALAHRLGSHRGVRAIRTLGLMGGVELGRPDGTSWPHAWRLGVRVCDEATRLGVRLRPLGDVVVLMPPLAIGADELDQLVDVLTEAIETVTAAYEVRTP
ncbi:MAG: adenosylmethionine--8-amino-7-oxononanoate transaminase [Planctomycetota bacterium]